MEKRGYLFRRGESWFLRYRDNFMVEGRLVRLQKCMKIAEYGDRYRRPRDLADESCPFSRIQGHSLRRFLGTAVRMHATAETSAKALGNSRDVAERHYIKPTEVLPDVRKAVNEAFWG
jgi:hypothetical protein